MSKRWLAKNKRDYYHKKSKEEGFRARAAYKLIQIDERFNIFKNVKSILDLGAAPGSWVQAILNKIGDRKPLIMGVDYKRMGDIDGARMLSINVYSEELEKEIINYFPQGIDLILSDMAPKITGNKELDAVKTIDLIRRALFFKKYLNPNGNFVAKVFHCPEMFELLNELKGEFQSAQTHKPKASRMGNRELYIIAKGFKSEKSES